jgi:hypothetical protein
MVSRPRTFLAAILLTTAAGLASARQTPQVDSPRPPLAPDAAVPAMELPQLPVDGVPPAGDTNPNTPAVDPAFTIDPSVFSSSLAAAPRSAAMSLAMPASVPSGTVVTSQLEGQIPDIAAVNTGATTTMLVGEWMLAGVLIVVLFGIITRIRRRQVERVIVDFTRLAPRLKPAPATRTYGPRPA